MKLPNCERAVVPEAKIVRYLLKEGHTAGGPKAAFFLRFGFSVTQWEVMAEALRAHAATHEIASTLDTPEGVHYAVEGVLQTPDGRNPAIRSVWAIDTGSESPRLITAYPLKSVRS
ncbi:MAG: hypothetical protein HZC41_20390 [Chloroflexi bacterium]|nr:hypothetical protein [Chloroflexota bacterium]